MNLTQAKHLALKSIIKCGNSQIGIYDMTGGLALAYSSGLFESNTLAHVAMGNAFVVLESKREVFIPIKS